MSLFFSSKICSVSVIITSDMDEKGRMDNKFYGQRQPRGVHLKLRLYIHESAF